MKLLVIKSAFRWFPEVFLTLSILYYWFLTANLFNYVAIGLLAVMAFQFYYNKRSLGLFIGGLLTLLSAYMFLALFSEVSEIIPFYPEGLTLMAIGTLYLGTTLFASISLLIKHLHKPCKKIVFN